MRALFGVVSLLVALAVVGLVAGRQLGGLGRASGLPDPNRSAGAASAPLVVRARTIEQRVASDVAAALQQGAAARSEADETR